MTLHEKFLGNLERLLPKGKTLLLAVSGGSDSIALLRLLVNSSKIKHSKTIVVAHFDHALRETSALDAHFVGELCQQLAISFYSERTNVADIARKQAWNLEDAARRLRYSFLTRVAKQVKADAILTAHTLDDQAETVLMQLLRGSAFLTGIKEKQNLIIRPLLTITRQELQDYLVSMEQDFRTDESNVDTSKTRAWLRHEILPLLGQRYPTIKTTLAQIANIQYEQKNHFEELAKNYFHHKNIEVALLLKQDIAMQRQVISLLDQRLEFKHIETIREHLGSKTPIRIALPENKVARIAYGKLNVLNSQLQSESTLPSEFEHLNKRWKRIIEQSIHFDKLEGFTNLILRYRKPGDTIKLSSGTKKVSDLLIDLKIPKEERDTILMLASDNNVLWIKDIATDIRISKKPENPDLTFMKRALDLAKQSVQQGDLPVGCVIVKDGQAIAEAFNQTEYNNSPFAHAETLALQQAAHHLNDWRLEGCILYVTLEPCPMCFGAMLQAHVSKVVYGAANFRDGALGSVLAMQNAPWKRHIEVKGGILEKECSKILSDFFKAKRT